MGSDSDSLFHLFDDPEFADANLAGADSPENLFSILETLENGPEIPLQQKPLLSPKGDSNTALLSSQRSISSSTGLVDSDTDMEGYPSCKRLKTSKLTNSEEVAQDGHQRISHITVERNRRKQMNEHLSVLRSLMPCFYVKRGDQASIIGGVVEFIKELQQVLQSLEAKRQRKVYSEVLSPRHVSSPRPSPLSPRPPSLSPRISLPITPPLSPRPPPLSPRMNLPLSPRTPQSPYMPIMQQPSYLSTANATSLDSSTSSSSIDNVKDLAANSKSSVAQVQVKFSGPNLLLKTTSHRIPGQALKIITALENLSLEILHVDINTTDDTLVNSFTIKIGIECELSVEELTHEIQLTFC